MQNTLTKIVEPTSDAHTLEDVNHPANESVIKKTELTNGETPLKITIILPTNAYFMSGIRDFTMTVTENMTGFSEQWGYRFQSVVDELINNAIEFGSATGKNITITFVSTKGKSIEVFVEDTGTGKTQKTAAEMMQYIENNRDIDPATIKTIRGRGLSQIVSKWADAIDFKDNPGGGLTAHVIKHFKPDEQL